MGCPALFRRSEKSPYRFNSVGTVDTIASLVSCRVRSQEPKKNVLLCLIGPPSVPPNWFNRIGGLSVAKKLRASSASLRSDSNALPRNRLVPDRVDIVTTPPVEWPYSAE